MRNTSSSLIAYKRGASLNSSTWYKSTLLTFLAESKDTGGNFSLAEASLTPGNEPPAHLHEREDELFYILEGEINAYVGREAFRVGVGECLFLPKRKPHAIIVRSLRIRVLVLFVPAGLEECFRAMSSPAEKLELPVEGGLPIHLPIANRQFRCLKSTPYGSCLQMRLRNKCRCTLPRSTRRLKNDQRLLSPAFTL